MVSATPRNSINYGTETVDGYSMISGYLVSVLFTICWLWLVRSAFDNTHTLSNSGPSHCYMHLFFFSPFVLTTIISNSVLFKISGLVSSSYCNKIKWTGYLKQQTWLSLICRCQGTNMAWLSTGVSFLIVDGLLCSI
jgi:hypothetical protein